jgi:hypothetical protein
VPFLDQPNNQSTHSTSGPKQALPAQIERQVNAKSHPARSGFLWREISAEPLRGVMPGTSPLGQVLLASWELLGAQALASSVRFPLRSSAYSNRFL